MAKFQYLAKYDNDLQAVLAAAIAAQIPAKSRNHVDYLRELIESLSPTVRHAADLLANAGRRHAEGRIDDAVARLYRAIESLPQLALSQRHNIPCTRHVPSKCFPKCSVANGAYFCPLADQITTRNASPSAPWPMGVAGQNGALFLGLQDACTLLDALNDPLAAAFKELELYHRERSPLTARNQSILAHGFERSSQATFRRMWDAALRLAQYEKSDLPRFPKLLS